MASSKGTNTYNRQNWEDSDFPILCQTCLGDNPYLRMMKERYGKECKICARPFATFRWCPGAKMRFKKTEVCQTCAKLKNVCQTCLLDLEYGLPIQVRDEMLKLKTDLPQSDVNREYYLQNVDANSLASTSGGGGGGKLPSMKNEVLSKLARTAPYYKRNRPHICSFWVKGECKRGEECPYRHERPNDPDDPLNDQNIRDRYYGVNDPVAQKLLKRAEALPKLEPPEDPLITTLYVGGLEDALDEKDISGHFYQYGEIRNISLVPKQGCAFVQFSKRSCAELAAEKTFNNLVIHGRKLTVRWGKSQGRQSIAGPSAAMSASSQVPGLPPGPLPPPPQELQNNFFNIPSTSNSSAGSSSALGAAPPYPGGTLLIHYPSQDPSRLGSIQMN
eukprot:TRINITY_DN7440_c0_g1_i1.p1 TRINITY_DN7440_c0_g1~~TRINITY_DN7440_c0_g1_i1.p1  ORF type:complete len:389 (+),score=128.09 TRINITY_DN7440_c0_g1_i1:83-1249(+)